FCASCGHGLQPDDNFCPACGAKAARTATSDDESS
ncbi:MAG: zinc-ribbon domain-containing protein, partial [Armatimonadetes bacterium]|nr:zinc-ribbon domain-containing protein [Armatimonadota bacterium]